MKYLSRILIDSYQDIKSGIPLMMEWNLSIEQPIGVSNSKGTMFVINSPRNTQKSAVFKISGVNIPLFDGVISSLNEYKIYNTLDECINIIKPKYFIGPTRLLNKKFSDVIETYQIKVLNHSLFKDDTFVVIPNEEILGTLMILANKNISDAYATYVINNPYKNIGFVQWKDI